MKIVIIGYGWVGQANALALALQGENVFYFDPQEPEKHYTAGYAEVYGKVAKLSSPLEQDSPETCYVVCVGDRVSEDGVQDISLIERALQSLAGAKGMVVLRSTVLPEKLKDLSFDFYLPEFLHEKKAVEECIKPPLFVWGANTGKKLPDFLEKWKALSSRVFQGTPEEASYIKYLSNIWHALQIAFINEFGDSVPKGSADKVIDFLFEKAPYRRYGKGFGGHCLPKDSRAFNKMLNSRGVPHAIMEALYLSNETHKSTESQNNLNEWFSEWK